MSTEDPSGGVIVRVLAGLGAVLLGFAGLLAAPLTVGASLRSVGFSIGAIAGSVTLLAVAVGLLRPRWYEWVGAGAAAAAATAAGLLVTDAGGCCLDRYSVHRGFPLAWHHGEDLDRVVTEGDVFLRPGRVEAGANPAAAIADVTAGIDRMYLLADLAFWAGVALTVIVLVRLALGARKQQPQLPDE